MLVELVMLISAVSSDRKEVARSPSVARGADRAALAVPHGEHVLPVLRALLRRSLRLRRARGLLAASPSQPWPDSRVRHGRRTTLSSTTPESLALDRARFRAHGCVHGAGGEEDSMAPRRRPVVRELLSAGFRSPSPSKPTRVL